MVKMTLFVEPRPEIPPSSNEEPELLKVAEAKVRTLEPAPDMVIVDLAIELNVKAPMVSEVPPEFPIKFKVPPPIVMPSASPRRPEALLPPLPTALSNVKVAPAPIEVAPAFHEPEAPLIVTVLLLAVSAPVAKLVPVKINVPLPASVKPLAPVPAA